MNLLTRLGIASLACSLAAVSAIAQSDEPTDPAIDRLVFLAQRLADQPDDIPPG